MVDGAILDGPLARTSAAVSAATILEALPLTFTVARRLGDIEAIWRQLEVAGIESPGQSFDFTRQWIEARDIPERDQLFVVAALEGRPLLLLPLQRHRRAGVSFYSWFPGAHVGCNAPLLDAVRFAKLTPGLRRALWDRVFDRIPGGDFVYLAGVPQRAYGIDGIFAELGEGQPFETLHRAAFSSWEEANTTQRSKSRRKHDRQQGERLEALGEVGFEVVEPGEAALPVLDEMFRQRARRFAVMGVKDPFAAPDIARFYAGTVAPGSSVGIKLHVLRLDGQIVAVRYNVVHGDRMFCLISSMSDDARIQGGSPGKQCLLRVMQTVFDEGFRVFDMGNGLTDEKRHWCNEQLALDGRYVPLSVKGRAIIAVHGAWRSVRTRIKSNPALLKLVKAARARLHGPSVAAKPETPAEAEA